MSDDLVRVEPPNIAHTALAPRAALVLPRLIVDAGPVAVEKFLEFFAARIANRRTRAAYGRAVGQFLGWCGARGLGLRAIAPLHVAAYIRTHPGSAPTVKQHLAAIRMLGDWLVVSQVLPVNPAAARPGAEARRHDGRDAGALAGRGPPAPRGDRHGHARGSARPGARLGDALQLRAGERGHRHAAAGLLPAGAPGVAQAAREGRPAARRPGPPSGGRGARRLPRAGRARRGDG